MEIYDVVFFDWVLLCHSGFFPHFYPELKGIVGPHMFGYNKKAHIRHFVVYIPACVAAVWLCALLCASAAERHAHILRPLAAVAVWVKRKEEAALRDCNAASLAYWGEGCLMLWQAAASEPAGKR